MNGVQRIAIAFLLSMLACGCDQITKYHAEQELSVSMEDGDRVAAGVVDVLPGFWEFQYRENSGAAFSFLADVEPGIRVPFFVIVTLMALGLLTVLVYRNASRWQMVAAALIAGGALGNLVDRIRYGYVVDFIHWHYRDAFDYPTFNVADAWILIGGLALVAFSFARPTPQAKES